MPTETMAYVWKPHPEHYTAYLGPVCINNQTHKGITDGHN